MGRLEKMKSGVDLVNKNFNEWYLEIRQDLDPTLISKREATIESYIKDVTADNIISLVKIFYGMGLDQKEVDAFAEVFQKNDVNFSKKYVRELEFLAGATLIEIAEHSPDHYLAETTTLAASFGGRKPSVNGILEEMRVIFDKHTLSIREKNNDAELPVFDLLDKLVSGVWTEESVKSFHTYIKDLNQYLESFKRYNDVCYEDSQLLWWLNSEWSRDLDNAYSTFDAKSVCLVVGKEAASLVNVLPGPYSIKGIFYKLLNLCKGRKDESLLETAIDKTPAEWRTKFVNHYGSSFLIDILPISSAIVRAENTTSSSQWIGKYIQEACVIEEELKSTTLQFAMQMYLEMLSQKAYAAMKN